MKVVAVRLMCRADEDAEDLAEELFSLMNDAYAEADDVTVLNATVSDPTSADLELCAARHGEDTNLLTERLGMSAPLKCQCGNIFDEADGDVTDKLGERLCPKCGSNNCHAV